MNESTVQGDDNKVADTEKPLTGRVCVVTGGARGIGRAEAAELVAQGASVVMVDLDREAVETAAAELSADGGVAVGYALDITDVAAAAELIDRVVADFGHVDALVNNAGILRDRSLVKMSEEEWDAVIRVHLRGHFAPTQAICRYFRESGRPGRIVCTSSTSGLLGNFGQTNYGAAKAGIASFSTIVAHEMARFGVTCNAIAPSAITRMTEMLMKDANVDNEGGFDFWSADNVAPLVAWLCGPDSSEVSGHVFGVQGDVVELYQPWTVAGEVTNARKRWTPDELTGAVDELFRSTGVEKAVGDPMQRLGYPMIQEV